MVNASVTGDLQARLRAEAAWLGFAAIGFAPATDDPVRTERLERWLGEGHHGSMEWMQSRADERRV